MSNKTVTLSPDQWQTILAHLSYSIDKYDTEVIYAEINNEDGTGAQALQDNLKEIYYEISAANGLNKFNPKA